MSAPVLRLHGYPVSNYCNVVRAALLEKHIEFEMVPCRPARDGCPLEHSPMGKIPFLETAEGFLAETIAILEFLEDTQPALPLYPSEPYRRARARQVINVVQMYVEAPARTLYPGVFGGGENHDVSIAAAKGVLERAAGALSRLVEPSPYLLGEHLTHTDLFTYYTLDLADRVTRTVFDYSFVGLVSGLDDWAKAVAERASTREVLQDFHAAFPTYLAEKGAAYRGDTRAIGELTK